MNKRKTGTKYEAEAAVYLKSRGYEILELNYRCRLGEIDIVARDGRYLVFVEVKYRRTNNQGGAAAAVSPAKQRTIWRVAAFYLVQHRLVEDTPCRFDVVAVDGGKINLIQDAFGYRE